MREISTADQQRSAVRSYREMAAGYVYDGYFERNRARLASAITDRARGAASAHEVRNRLIIEAYGQAAERAGGGEDVSAALDRAESELNELVEMHNDAASAGYVDSGYLEASEVRLTNLLDTLYSGSQLTQSQLVEGLQRIFVDENCRGQDRAHSSNQDAPTAGKVRSRGAPSPRAAEQENSWSR